MTGNPAKFCFPNARMTEAAGWSTGTILYISCLLF